MPSACRRISNMFKRKPDQARLIARLNERIGPLTDLFVYRSRPGPDGKVRLQVGYRQPGAQAPVNITKQVAQAFGFVLLEQGIFAAPWALIETLCEYLLDVTNIR